MLALTYTLLYSHTTMTKKSLEFYAKRTGRGNESILLGPKMIVPPTKVDILSVNGSMRLVRAKHDGHEVFTWTPVENLA
jgi:hypothetical protein